MQEHQFISKTKEYRKEKGDEAKTFSKVYEFIVGHVQPISNVRSPNEARYIITPKKIKRRQRQTKIG